MAIGTTETKTVGRFILDLERGEEKTTRTIDVAYPKTDITTEGLASLQAAVNNADSIMTANYMNIFVQPANWRDLNIREEQWTTTGVHYEIVTTSVTPIDPDEPEPEPEP